MGLKLAELNIHEGAVLKSSLRPNQTRGISGGGSYGRLFAFDSEGQHVLTCGPNSGLIYKVCDEIENIFVWLFIHRIYHRKPSLYKQDLFRFYMGN